MGVKRRDYNTFAGKVVVALAMMSVIPYLFIIYLILFERIDLSFVMLLFAPLILLSVFSGFALLRKSSSQIDTLRRETSMIESGAMREPIRLDADRELVEIANHFNSLYNKLDEMNRKNQEQATQLMVYAHDLAISYQKTRQEAELRNRLSRYVGNNLVERLMNLKEGVFLETERRGVTVLFADIRSFTALAEKMAAEDVVLMLNQYFSVMVDIIFKNGGLLDKFVGDQLIAVFGLVETDENMAAKAIQTGIEMQAATYEMMRGKKAAGESTFEIGIGINTGVAIIGNIGSANRMDYTVIGDCVNVAARLEQMAAGGEVLIGEQTYLENDRLFDFESKGEISIKNKLEPVVCYNVLWDGV
ncbi:MAG: adenylate/guanylate cyclase domain-containing protein [Deltaproteobacteria bacterium]|nr:adenylate/guanylate cyclase domain-containing protein [Deltaproteobacteria bacterium]